MTLAYLSLGSNLGDRLGYLTEAVRRLEAGHTQVTKVSSVFETVPQGVAEQPAYLNLAVEVETHLDPLELLGHIQAVEQSLGRVRKERWGARTIDLDIALFGDVTCASADLTIPHPRMMERAFVLTPLTELKPDPALQEQLTRLPDQGVAPYLDAKTFLQRVRGVQ